MTLARYQLSKEAELDLDGIIGYTLSTWDEQQADRYTTEIRDCCRLLANKPEIGRLCQWDPQGLRRMEHKSHVIFYEKTGDGIMIVRILHKSMEPQRAILKRNAK
ncbi:MAG TPA: type II toxin-antitoxin system RelE/ParE family toxin [Acidobacteriaceae bacterium]|nr:type II toxin-antitoxin system RelE/ParE family toxin [Acidobacteriaceae bacterium]